MNSESIQKKVGHTDVSNNKFSIVTFNELALKAREGILFFSSPEPSDSHVELIVYPCCSVRRRHFQQFQISPLKPLGQPKPNFLCSLPWKGERKFIYMVLVTWPRWPPCQYMVNTFKNPIQNQKSYNLETWHVAPRTPDLQSLYKC